MIQATHKKFSPRNVAQKPDFHDFANLPPLIQNRVPRFANKAHIGCKAKVNSANISQKHFL